MVSFFEPMYASKLNDYKFVHFYDIILCAGQE